MGTVALLLSVLGTRAGPRRWRFFWLAVVVSGIVLAFGRYSPVYPILQTIVPLFRSFRYPAKFLVFTSFGVAAFEGLTEARAGGAATPRAIKAACAVGVAIAAALVILVAPFTGARAFFNLAASVGVADPVSGAAYLFKRSPSGRNTDTDSPGHRRPARPSRMGRAARSRARAFRLRPCRASLPAIRFVRCSRKRVAMAT